MGKYKLKVLEDLWIDFSKIVGMKLDKQPLYDEEKKELRQIYSVVALTAAGNIVLLQDTTSNVPDKCVRFIQENWVEK